MSFAEPQYPVDDVRAALDVLFETQLFVTTTDLAEELGCTRETARVKLHELVDADELTARTVGANAKVWYPASFGVTTHHDALGNEDAPPEPSDPEASDGSERVLFFPSRREFVASNPDEGTRRTLSEGAHLIDSTGDGYLYKVSPEDVWNSPYESFDAFRDSLKALVAPGDWSPAFESRINEDWTRAHTFRLVTREGDGSPYTVLSARDEDGFQTAKRKLSYNDHYTEFLSNTEFRIKNGSEASVKETLYDEGFPVIDERRLERGADLPLSLVDDLSLREYQQEWVDSFAGRNAGVFVGPPGCGKTVAALGAMERVGGETLILVPSVNLANQWEAELLEKTTLSARHVGQYHGEEKRVRPVTIATYQTASMSRHRELFNERAWGLVVADECHHAVSKTWKRFHGIQSTARLGLTATPVRESGSAREIYTLIGPPLGTDWGRLFAEEWVEKPDVEIITVPWGSETARRRYERAEGTQRLIEAAKNPAKPEVVRSLLADHEGERAIVFVDWLDQGRALSEALDLPFICGETPHAERERLFEAFRSGEVSTLLISRVGDEGIDLPNAEVAVLTSTMGRSRAQTGQRAGRTMRPVGNSKAYVLLTDGSGEADWGRESTQFLSEKGIAVSKRKWDA